MAQSAEDAIRRFLDGYNAHDVDAVARVFAPDAVYDDKGTGKRYEGKEAVLGYVREAFSGVPDCAWQLHSLIAADDRAAFEGTWSGTWPGGTRSVRLEAATIIATREGLITSLVDYYSFPTLD